jgi:hypothetical protein
MDWDDYFRQPAVIVFTQPRPTGDIAASQQAKHRCHSLARRAQKKRLGDRIWFQPVVVRGLHGVGRRGLPGRRSSMLLAISSHTAAKSTSSCLMKASSVFWASCRYSRCAENRWKDHLSGCEFRCEDSNARSISIDLRKTILSRFRARGVFTQPGSKPAVISALASGLLYLNQPTLAGARQHFASVPDPDSEHHSESQASRT